MHVLREFRLACRRLLKAPSFSLVALVLLAAGIGANATIFSFVNSVLLRKFPYKDPDRLVMVWEKNPTLSALIAERVPTAYSNFQEWAKQNTVFESIAGFEDASLNRTSIPAPERVAGARVSPNFFSVLGVAPLMGNGFEQAGSSQVALLSYAYYQSHFGDSNPVGQTLTLNGAVYTISGVLSPEFYLPSTREGGEQRRPDLFIPYDLATIQAAPDLRRRKMQVFARLKPGVTMERARAEMEVIAGRLQQQDPNLNIGFGSNVFSIYEEDTGKKMRSSLLYLLAAVGFVLLLVCANIANLMLGRALARQREMAVRRSLGAGNWQMLSQILYESLTLSLMGGVLGLLLAQFGIKALLAMNPTGILRPDQIHLSLNVVFFTFLVSALAAVISAVAPATQVLRGNLAGMLQQSSGGHVAGASQLVRSILVVVEVTLALVLVTGSAFMMRSLFAVMQVDPGFAPDHMLTMRLELPSSRYRTPDELAAFCKRVTDGLQAAPGIRAASFSDGLPLTRVRMMKFVVEDQPMPKPGSEPAADMRGITTPVYFDALKLPILHGRNFTEDEIAQKQPVIVINQSLAKKLWPGQDAVGKHIRGAAALKPGDQPTWLTVIGVVKDTKQAGLEDATRPEVTRPMVDYTILTLSVRTTGDPAAITSVVRQQIGLVDKDLPLFQVRTMQEILDDSTGQRQFDSVLITIFAGVALLLAAIGLYGVLMSLVTQRTQEIGIRMALGAQRSHVLRIIFGHGFKLVGIGLVLGVAGSFMLGRLLSSMVFNVSLFDPITYIAVVALMLLTSGIAIYLPARKAITVDPLRAIRYE